jgi:hypothetical protein
MSFLRHREIFPSDGGANLAANTPAHRLDEFPAGYSLAGCAPAEPAAASPTDHYFARSSFRRTMSFHRTASCRLTGCLSPGVHFTDGYLWLGTDEGLARFDGYDFTVFNKDNGDLPSNSVTVLASGTDGSLWIGTTNGLTYYKGGRFHTFTVADGLSANQIGDLHMDQAGVLWVVAGGALSRIAETKITIIAEAKDVPFPVRAVSKDSHGVLWIAGISGLAKWTGGKVVSTINAAALDHNVITRIVVDKDDNLWLAGSRGIVQYQYCPAIS